MKKIKVSVSTGYTGSKREDEFEIEDDATEEEINEVALEVMFQLIDFGWMEVED